MKYDTRKAAAIQMATGPNVSANLLTAEQLVEDAVNDNAGLIVLPENFAYMGKAESDVLAIKEQQGDGPLQNFLSQLASKHGIWIVGGTVPIECCDQSKVFASSLVYNDRGEQVARYDKIHLFDVHLVEADEQYSESSTIEPGSETCVINTPFGKLGVAICYDLRFPELFRNLVDRGVEIIALPAAFTAITGKAHWETLVRARAIENLSYVIAAAQGGFHLSGRETYGHSMIVDPWGSVLAQVPRGPGSVSVKIDIDFLTNTRRNFPCIDHRKLYCEK
ncbi:MAG: carbon-nitrogen hydrolase family protein [Gammaproteobacteria bacterium]|nr:carbon-nitrogen hydrolase family protein [Gammaproteobacteria bacterium]